MNQEDFWPSKMLLPPAFDMRSDMNVLEPLVHGDGSTPRDTNTLSAEWIPTMPVTASMVSLAPSMALCAFLLRPKAEAVIQMLSYNFSTSVAS